VAQALSTRLGQVFVVENRPGAGGTIGANLVAKAAPDGYTLLVNSSGHTVNPSIYPSLPFDTAKDFTGVSLLAEQPNILVVAPSKGWKTAGDLVKAAKAEPGKLTYASAGAGSATHMNAEKFRVSAAIDAVHIPYKGTPEALTDTMNGRVDYFFAPVIAALPMVRDNRVTALAVGSAKRASVLPDVPTTEEAGYPGSAYNFWVGMLAPAGTPPAIVAKLNAAFRETLAAPETRERLANFGAEAKIGTPEAFGKLIADELALWQGVVRDANITME
jgi:tripartite-type tricarboxylate transporter receptor subunit TctC